MKKIILLSSFLLLLLNIGKSQQVTNCGTNQGAINPIQVSSSCSQTINYAPDNFTESKLIRITFHVLQDF